jgi:hypothetical protein
MIYKHEIPAATVFGWLDACYREDVGEINHSIAVDQLGHKNTILVQIGSNKKPWNSNEYTWALILEPTGDTVSEFRRIGIAGIAEDLVKGWETRTFSII